VEINAYERKEQAPTYTQSNILAYKCAFVRHEKAHSAHCIIVKGAKHNRVHPADAYLKSARTRRVTLGKVHPRSCRAVCSRPANEQRPRCRNFHKILYYGDGWWRCQR
jgi:hypothetical protein